MSLLSQQAAAGLPAQETQAQKPAAVASPAGAATETAPGAEAPAGKKSVAKGKAAKAAAAAPAVKPAANLTTAELAVRFKASNKGGALDPTGNGKAVAAKARPVSEQPAKGGLEGANAPEGEVEGETETDSTSLSPTAEADEAGEGEEGAGAATESPEPAWRRRLSPEVREALDLAALPNSQQKLVARIHQLVDERDSLKGKGGALDSDRANTREEGLSGERPANVPAVDAIGMHPDVQQIESQMANLEALTAWAEEHPEGGTLVNQKTGKPVELDEAQVRAQRKAWDRQLADLRGERAVARRAVQERFAAVKAETMKVAAQVYPWMNDAKSPEYQEALAVLNETPGVMLRPDWEIIVGDMVTGRLSRKARIANGGKAVAAVRTNGAATTTRPNGAAKPAAKQPTPIPGAPGAKVADKGVLEEQFEAAREEFRRSGSQKAMTRMLSAQKQLQAAR